jgi:hypothetical protein
MLAEKIKNFLRIFRVSDIHDIDNTIRSAVTVGYRDGGLAGLGKLENRSVQVVPRMVKRVVGENPTGSRRKC